MTTFEHVRHWLHVLLAYINIGLYLSYCQLVDWKKMNDYILTINILIPKV